MRAKQAWKKVNRLDNFPMPCSDTIPHLQLLQRLLRERGNNILTHFHFSRPSSPCHSCQGRKCSRKNGSILLRKNDPPLTMYELFRYGREILCWRGLVSKFTETKPAHSPKRVDGSVTIQKLPTAEGVRKERKRKIESGIIDDETRLMVSLLNTISLEKRSPLICLKR